MAALLSFQATPAQDVFSSQGAPSSQGDESNSNSAGSQGGGFIIVSITRWNDTTWDVKLQNPRTGYIHSITLHFGGDELKPGERVNQSPDGTLQPLTPQNAPPAQNLDPGNGPLTGYVSNDPEDPNNPDATGGLGQQLQALNDAIGQVPGLPQALQAGAAITKQQADELKKDFDLTKPHTGLKYIFAAIANEPQALAGFAKAGAAQAAKILAEQASKEAIQQAETTTAKNIAKAVTDAVEAEKVPPPAETFGPHPQSQWPPPPGSPESRLQRDYAKGNPGKVIKNVLTKGKYDNSAERAANGPMKRMLYWLHVAETQGKNPEEMVDLLLNQNGITGKEAELDKEVILTNLKSLDKWGVFNNNANLLRMRGGGSPYSTVLNDSIDVIHTLAVRGAENFANKIFNLRMGPHIPNVKAGNSWNATRLAFAKTLNESGLMTNEDYQAILQAAGP